MNQNDNKLAGQKCRDNIPQLESKLVCHICKNRKQKGFRKKRKTNTADK